MAHSVVDVVLHGYGISQACGLLVNANYVACFWIVFELIVKRVVGSSVVVSRKDPSFFALGCSSLPMSECTSTPDPSRLAWLVLYLQSGWTKVENRSSISLPTLSTIG